MSHCFARTTWGGSVLVLLALVAQSGCDRPSGSLPTTKNAARTGPANYPYVIVTTCSMVTDIVGKVAGPHATVKGLMGEGVDPHLFKPTRGDVDQLMHADVVFYAGLTLEGRMGETFTRVARGGKPVYAVSEGIDESTLREPPEFSGHWDPHVWMDVELWSAGVAFVAKSLAEFDPSHADEYLSRAAAYRDELRGLDAYIRTAIASIPEQQRVLITAHDAFGYFGRRYGITVRSVQGLTTESEASVDDINRLVEFIVQRQIRAIFIESSVSPKNIRAIIEGAAQKRWEVAIGGELFSDAMGASGSYEGTYLGMLDHNATVIARALGGDVPARGWKGKLAL